VPFICCSDSLEGLWHFDREGETNTAWGVWEGSFLCTAGAQSEEHSSQALGLMMFKNALSS